jgi:hypothetical protein
MKGLGAWARAEGCRGVDVCKSKRTSLWPTTGVPLHAYTFYTSTRVRLLSRRHSV